MIVKNGKFYAEWSEFRDGKRKRERKTFDTRREAQKYQDRKRDEVRVRKLQGIGSVKQLTEAWLEGRPGSARDRYHERMVSASIIEVAGDLPVTMLTPMIPNALVEKWKKQFSVANIYNLRFRLRQLLRWFEQHGGKGLSDLLQRTPTPQPRQILVDPGDLAKMKAASPPWFRCFLLFCFDGGLRRGEAMRVSPMHYSPELGRITIEVKKRRIQSFTVTDELKDLLAQAATGSAPFLELLRGKKVTRKIIEQWWDKMKKQVGAASLINTHDLRRTAATQLFMQTHDIFIVQRFLGHASPVTTMRYIAHVANLELKPIVEEMKVIYSRRTAAGGITKLGAS